MLRPVLNWKDPAIREALVEAWCWGLSGKTTADIFSRHFGFHITPNTIKGQWWRRKINKLPRDYYTRERNPEEPAVELYYG